MASVDELFRGANGSLKRKLVDPSATFSHASSSKSQKQHDTASPHGYKATSSGSTNGGRAQRASVEEAAGDAEDDDVEAGPALPPDDDEDVPEDDIEDDEEGRFFGGGVSKQEKDVLNYIEQNDDETEEKIDLLWLKKTAVSFERKINKNAELRAKYEDAPLKFVASEADLDTEIKSLTLLSDHTYLYKDFVRSGCADSLVGLLAHENTDIAITVCEVVAELTDDDGGASDEEWDTLVKALLQADLVDLLTSNLRRLDEQNDNDRAGVYHVLSVMENLSSSRVHVRTLGTNIKLLEWLLKRIQKPDEDARNKVGQNRQYAAEILAILVQSSDEAAMSLAKLKAVDPVLGQLNTWTRRDPEQESDEEEFAENLFDCLVSLVKQPEAAEAFLADEGVELCLLMLKHGNFSKTGALRLLDHATGTKIGPSIAEKIVEAEGLKPLFTTFMKGKKLSKDAVEHILGIFASMLKYLPQDTPARIRTLAKFVEKNYEKIERLISLRNEYSARLRNVEKQIEAGKDVSRDDDDDNLEEDFLSRRLDAGLFALQTLDVILAWLVAEDDGARERIKALLFSKGDLGAIRSSLEEQLKGMDISDSEEALSSKDMLETLLSFLQ